MMRNGSDHYQYNQNPAAGQAQVFEHPCLPLTKILGSGSFYYALEPHWDLSTRLGARLGVGGRDVIGGKKDLGAFDERFVWNEYIVRSLLDFRERLDVSEREDLDRCQFIVSRFILRTRGLGLISLLDSCYTGVCWRVDNGIGSPTDRWLTDHSDTLTHLAAWMETRRDTIQYTGR